MLHISIKFNNFGTTYNLEVSNLIVKMKSTAFEVKFGK